MKKSKRLSLTGWEITSGSFYHTESKTTVYRTWDYSSRKAYWHCKQPGYKSEDFSTVFDAIKEVNKRLGAVYVDDKT